VANSRQPWDDVFDRVRVYRNPDEVCARPVTDSDLDRAESELKVRLPASYRAFAIRFRLPGEVMAYLRLDPLFVRHRTDSSVLSMTRWMREDIAAEQGAEEYCPLERLRQFVAFGDDRGGGWFVFDPTERTSLDPLEYRIYWMPKHHYPIEHRADTFTDFIQWVDQYVRELDEGIADELEDIEERRDPRIRWLPYEKRKKKEPRKEDVKRWLAFNNSAARDLALAIRGGRTDAFPILADALQEAGCANADLLDSCRTGDPGIDGVWVLRVLLGET
jgi:hypothetical protein